MKIIQKNVFKCVLILIAVLFATAITWSLITHSQSSKTKSVIKRQTKLVGIDELLSQADTAIAENRRDKAQVLYDEALGLAKSKTDQAKVELAWSLTEYNSKQYDKGLIHAKKSDALVHSAGTSKAVALCYEALGDKANALENYKISYDRTSSRAKALDNTIQSEYDDKIKALSQ